MAGDDDWGSSHPASPVAEDDPEVDPYTIENTKEAEMDKQEVTTVVANKVAIRALRMIYRAHGLP